MKMTRLGLILTVGSAAMLAGSANAQDALASPKILSKLDVSYVSKYIWRGAVLNPDPCVQPSLTLNTASGLSYNLWMSANVKDGVAGSGGSVVENDHTVNYPFTLGKYAMNAGYIYYAFPNTSYKSTQEIYSSVCFGGKFSPTLSANYDFDEIKGAYLALSTGYCCGLPFSKDPASPMNLSAKLGFGTSGYNKNTYAAPDKAALLDFVISANTTFSLGGAFSMTPSLTYSTIVDKGVRDSVSKPDNFIAGLTVSSAF